MITPECPKCPGSARKVDLIRISYHRGLRGRPYMSRTIVIDIGKDERLAIIEEVFNAPHCKRMRWAIFPWFGDRLWNGVEIARGWHRREFGTKRFKSDVGFIAESFRKKGGIHHWTQWLKGMVAEQGEETAMRVFLSEGVEA